MKIALIVSLYYPEISKSLLKGAVGVLREAGVMCDTIEVPGAFEIPYATLQCAQKKIYDGIVALGCVIQGETHHFTAVCDATTYGIQKVSLEHKIPIGFGVLMCKTMEQARARCSEERNKGDEAARALLKLIKNTV